jgi:hypothetical protein
MATAKKSAAKPLSSRAIELGEELLVGQTIDLRRIRLGAEATASVRTRVVDGRSLRVALPTSLLRTDAVGLGGRDRICHTRLPG